MLKRPQPPPPAAPRAMLAFSLARHAEQLTRWANDGVEGARYATTVLHALATIVHHGAWDALPRLAQAAREAAGDLDRVEIRETRVVRPGWLDAVLPPGPKRTAVMLAVAVALFLLTLVAHFVAPGA